MSSNDIGTVPRPALCCWRAVPLPEERLPRRPRIWLVPVPVEGRRCPWCRCRSTGGDRAKSVACSAAVADPPIGCPDSTGTPTGETLEKKLMFIHRSRISEFWSSFHTTKERKHLLNYSLFASSLQRLSIASRTTCSSINCSTMNAILSVLKITCLIQANTLFSIILIPSSNY